MSIERPSFTGSFAARTGARSARSPSSASQLELLAAAQMSEKQSLDKEEGVSSRRGSQTSIEDPTSPASSSGDGDSILSHSDHDRYNGDFPEKTLEPHISRKSPSLYRTQTNKSMALSVMTTDPAFEVDFADGEQANPQNWPTWYKSLIIFVSTSAEHIHFEKNVQSLTGRRL